MEMQETETLLAHNEVARSLCAGEQGKAPRYSVYSWCNEMVVDSIFKRVDGIRNYYLWGKSVPVAYGSFEEKLIPVSVTSAFLNG